MQLINLYKLAKAGKAGKLITFEKALLLALVSCYLT